MSSENHNQDQCPHSHQTSGDPDLVFAMKLSDLPDSPDHELVMQLSELDRNQTQILHLQGVLCQLQQQIRSNDADERMQNSCIDLNNVSIGSLRATLDAENNPIVDRILQCGQAHVVEANACLVYIRRRNAEDKRKWHEVANEIKDLAVKVGMNPGCLDRHGLGHWAEESAPEREEQREQRESGTQE